MIAAAVMLAVVIAVAAYVIGRRSSHVDDFGFDQEVVYKTAAELHDIRRRIDVALTRCELARDAARLRHQIEEVLNRDRP